MDYERIATTLNDWNVELEIKDNPEFCKQLEGAYPGWKLADCFSKLLIRITEDPFGHGLLFRDGREYIRLSPQHALLYAEKTIIADGFVTVGGGPTGDFLVIDTKDEGGTAIGFISHEELWELEMSARSCYAKVATDLESYLEELSSNPNCLVEHPGFPPDNNPWDKLRT